MSLIRLSPNCVQKLRRDLDFSIPDCSREQKLEHSWKNDDIFVDVCMTADLCLKDLLSHAVIVVLNGEKDSSGRFLKSLLVNL